MIHIVILLSQSFVCCFDCCYFACRNAIHHSPGLCTSCSICHFGPSQIQIHPVLICFLRSVAKMDRLSSSLVVAFVAVSLGAYFTYKKRKNQMAIMVPTSSAITRSNTLPSTKLSLMEWRDGDLNLKEIVAGGACYAGVYTDVCEKDAVDLILYQYEKGIRSFDVACHYGKGVAETRLGLAYKALGKEKMQDVQTCTKVGRYLVPKNTVQETLTSKAEGNPHICEEEAEAIFHNGDESVSQLRDYSYGGIRESYSQSLKRLQLSEYAKDGKLNMILRVHDCEDEKSFELAEQSIAALQDLKKGVTDDDGVLLPKVCQIGIGMNDNHYIDKFIALHEQMVRDTTLASSSGYRLGRG